MPHLGARPLVLVRRAPSSKLATWLTPDTCGGSLARLSSRSTPLSDHPRWAVPLRVLPTAHVPLSTPAVGWQEDVFIGELKFDDKEGNTLGCLRFAFSQLGLEEKEL